MNRAKQIKELRKHQKAIELACCVMSASEFINTVNKCIDGIYKKKIENSYKMGV